MFVIIFLITLLVVSNLVWVVAWNQFDYAEEQIDVQGNNGIANYIGQDGDIYNGKDQSETENKDTP